MLKKFLSVSVFLLVSVLVYVIFLPQVSALGQEEIAPLTQTAEPAAESTGQPESATQPQPAAQELIDKVQIIADTIWVLVTAFLVFFMQCGFAALEAGFTRAKNVVNILMKNLLDFSISSVTYWFFGFAIMFGAGTAIFGTSGFLLQDPTGQTFDSLSWTNVPLPAKFFFQLVFAGTAATIVSGALAERTRFVSYLIYSVVISGIIYPVVGHWIWGGGWLAELGMFDFAGSTVVHSTAGWLGLVGAFMLGPRIGKYNPDGSPNAILGHSMSLAFLGTFFLWLGWFGFNPGSTMAAVPEIAHIVMTTNTAAASAALTAMFTSWAVFRKPDAGMTLNGALAGLVGITAPCAFVSNISAIIIGIIAGILVVASVLFIDRILRVDDPVGAISVHATAGVWGTLAVGLFAEDKFMPGTTGNGLFFGGGWNLFGAQLLGVIAIFVWCMVAGFVLFGVLRGFGILRVSREEELRGLDIGEHGNEGYAGFQIFAAE